MNEHMAQYKSETKKGITRDTESAKLQLLFDRAVTCDCRAIRSNLGTVLNFWIDNKKVYDLYLHTWILGFLEMYKQDSGSLQVKF